MEKDKQNREEQWKHLLARLITLKSVQLQKTESGNRRTGSTETVLESTAVNRTQIGKDWSKKLEGSQQKLEQMAGTLKTPTVGPIRESCMPANEYRHDSLVLASADNQRLHSRMDKSRVSEAEIETEETETQNEEPQLLLILLSFWPRWVATTEARNLNGIRELHFTVTQVGRNLIIYRNKPTFLRHLLSFMNLQLYYRVLKVSVMNVIISWRWN